jgi:Uma2 family endonuclease
MSEAIQHRMSIDIAVVNGIRSIRRPDVTVQCGQADPAGMTAVEPRVLVEVLSPSTMEYDRVRKLGEYKRLASVAAVLPVDTEVPRATVYRRDGEVFREDEARGLGAVVDLPAIGARLALADVHEGVHDART